MGLILSEILARIENGGSVPLAMATNDDTLLVTYGIGQLFFRPASKATKGPRSATLATRSQPGLKLFFSDRMRMIDSGGATFQPPPRQPFDADHMETPSMVVSQLGATPIFTLLRTNQQIAIRTALQGRVYVGRGEAFGGALEAVYLFSFGNVEPA